VIEGSKGFMWFATINGLYRYDGQNFKSFRYQPDDSTSISGNYLTSYLFEDKDSCIWVGTAADGLNKFNRSTETFRRFKHNSNNPGSISNGRIVKLYQDNSGTIWIATKNGLNKYHPETEEFSIYKPDPNHLISDANNILSMLVDKEGMFWIGTYNGLFQFDKEENTFQKLAELSRIQSDYKYISFRDIAEDNEGTLWFGTNCGLIGYNKESKIISRFSHQENDPGSMIDNDILRIAINPDNGGNIFWLATTGGLISFNRKKEYFLNYIHNPQNSYSLSSNILWDIYLDYI